MCSWNDGDVTLYRGASGIALFLAECARLTSDRNLRRAALAGARYAALHANAGGPPTGFYVGRIGIAYALARIARAAGDEQCLDAARRTVVGVIGAVDAARDAPIEPLDVVSGVAGSIAPLIELGAVAEMPAARELAQRLGAQLLRVAHHGATGWTWGSRPPWHSRPLTGFAHGASGFGYALLELFAASGNAEFRYGGEQAFAYEQAVFNSVAGNWPDFRNFQLMEAALGAGGAPSNLKRAAASAGHGRLNQRFSLAWCHGAPGIALTRFRAAEILPRSPYLEEALRAATTTARYFGADGERDYSLCHGAFGLCETLLTAAERFPEAGWREQVYGFARRAADRYERSERPWPSGVADQAPNESLMLGDAGIGYLFLRLADEALPSVLLTTVSAAHVPSSHAQNSPTVDSIRSAYVNEWFGGTVRAFDALGAQTDYLARASRASRPGREVRAVFQMSSRIIRDAGDSDRATMLADAFAVDRARYELAVRLEHADDQNGALEFPPCETLAELQLSTSAVLVTTQYDWDGWLERADRAAAPDPDPVTYLLYEDDGLMRTHRVGWLSALILDSARAPVRRDHLIQRVFDRVPAEASIAEDEIRRRIERQIDETCAAGLLVTTPAPPIGGAGVRVT